MSKRKELRDLSEMTQQFFKYLEEKRWKDAETVTTKIKLRGINTNSNWMHGYLDALHGMLFALRHSHSSPEPYIQKISKNPQMKLKKLKSTFYKQSHENLNTDYDRGFFRTWYEYLHYKTG